MAIISSRTTGPLSEMARMRSIAVSGTVAAGILVFPGAGCHIARGCRVAVICRAVSGDGYCRRWGSEFPVVNRPGRRIGLQRGRFSSRQGVRRCSEFLLWAILSLLVGCRIEDLGGRHWFIFRQQFGRQFASRSLASTVGPHGDGLRDGWLMVYQTLPTLAEIVSENGHVPVGVLCHESTACLGLVWLECVLDAVQDVVRLCFKLQVFLSQMFAGHCGMK